MHPRAYLSRPPFFSHAHSSLNVLGGVKVDVFVRVRPPTEIEANDPIVVSLDKEAATVTLTDNSGYETKYAYDKVYGIDSTQEQLYNDAVAPIVEQVCRGLSCCIFAYGQTGAGKTYTMRQLHKEMSAKWF